MKKSALKLTTIIPLVFLLCIGWVQKVEVETKKGVKIIRNPKAPVSLPGSPSTLILKEDLVIGEETEKEDYWFSFVNSIAVDDSENIYVFLLCTSNVSCENPPLPPPRRGMMVIWVYGTQTRTCAVHYRVFFQKQMVSGFTAGAVKG